MKSRLIQPYKILWWSIPIVIIPSALGLYRSFDLQLHDTYFVIGSRQVAITFSVLLGLLGCIYWLVKDYRLINILSLCHSIITSLTIIGVIGLAICQNINNLNSFYLLSYLNFAGVILIGLLVVIQFIFIINLPIGLKRGKKGGT